MSGVKKRLFFLSIFFVHIFFSVSCAHGMFSFLKPNIKNFLGGKKSFKKKSCTIQIGDNEVGIIDCKNYKGKQIVQLSVANQFEKGTPGSCGYNMLKDAICLVKALEKKDIPESLKEMIKDNKQLQNRRKKNLATKLDDRGLVEQFFGNICSSWRKRIILGRLEFRLKVALNNDWKKLVGFPDINESGLDGKKVSQFYLKVFSLLASKASKEALFKGARFSFQEKSDVEMFLHLIRDSCNKKSSDDINGYYRSHIKNISKENLKKRLCSVDTINKYVDCKKLKDIVVSPDNYMNLIKNNEENNKKGVVQLGRRSLDGDYLDGREIKVILRQEESNGILKGLKGKVSWVVCGDTSLLGTEFDPYRESFSNAVKKALSDSNHKVVLCVGTMKSGRDKNSGTCGHWFPVIWTKNRIYVTDSLNNKSRINDPWAKKVLEVFENEKVRAKNLQRFFSSVAKSSSVVFCSKKVLGPKILFDRQIVLNS